MTRISTRSAVVVAVAAAGLAAMAPAVAQAASHSGARHPAARHPAAATVVNLIKDSGAEKAKPDSAGGLVKVPGWNPAKGTQFTAVAYGASGGFPASSSPGPKHRGKAFFAGGPSGNSSSASQTDSLKADATLIASGKAKFALTGWLGGFSSQADYATLTVTWISAKGKALGHTTIGPVTPTQRHDVTGMLRRSKSGTVPKGAASARVSLRMVRVDGSYIDGYADNLSLTISS